jgi:hypothetical protein
MIRCDVCGKQVKNHSELEEIKQEYQTSGVKEVCGECLKEISDAVHKINNVLYEVKETQVKRFITFFKERVSLETKKDKGSDK